VNAAPASVIGIAIDDSAAEPTPRRLSYEKATTAIALLGRALALL
jgi:hypothetical protein